MTDEYPMEVVAAAYRNLFTGMAGEIVMQDLKQICHAEKITFTDSALLTAFNEGQRSIFLYIMDKVNAPVSDDILTQTTMEEEHGY